MYIEHHALYSRSKATAESQVRVLKVFLAGRPLAEITPTEIQNMIQARLDARKSRATVNRNLASLSKIFSLAIDKWGIYSGPNPCTKIERFKESPGRTRYLTEEEAQRLIDAASDHLKPLIFTALLTGGRLGELLAMTWADIDLEAGVLYFRSTNTKSGKERMVPIAPVLADALRTFGPGRPQEAVFRFRGRPFSSIRTSFARARRKAGLGRDVTMHTCRHSYSSWAVMNGLDLYRLQRYLGHSTIALTQRYAHLSPQFLKDGARFFGAPFKDRS